MDTNNEIAYYKKMLIRSTASLIEIIGGQPLDRWKINQQLPNKYRLNMKQLLNLGIKEYYVASYTVIFQRCILYIPSIYFLGDYYDNKISKNSNLDYIVKPLAISLLITPQVSLFESLKTDQQVKNINNPIKHLIMKYKYGGIKNIMPTFTATFLRETSFSGGICVLTPLIYNKLENSNYKYIDVLNKPLVSGMLSGAITQIISQPFDTIKTYQEYNTKNNFFQTIKLINKNEGLSGFYNGGFPRCIRGVWTLGCLSYITSILENHFK